MTFVWALLCMLFWGLWAFFPKLAQRELNNTFSSIVYQSVSGLLWTALLFAALGTQKVAPGVLEALRLPELKLVWSPRGVLYAAIAGLAGSIGGIFYYIATAKGSVAVVSSITAIYPIVAILLAWRILDEKLAWWQWIGVALAIVAMGLLAPSPGSNDG